MKFVHAAAACLLAISTSIEAGSEPPNNVPSEIRGWMNEGLKATWTKPNEPLWVLSDSVKTELLNEKTRTTFERDLQNIWAGNKGYFRAANARVEYVNKLRTAAEQQSAQTLRAAGVPPEIAVRISTSFPRTWIRELDLVAVSRAELDRLLAKNTADGLSAIRRKALISTLKKDVKIDEIRDVTAAVPVKLASSESPTALIDSAADKIKNVLSQESSKWLSTLTQDAQREFLLDVKETLVAESTRASQVVADVRKAQAQAEAIPAQLFQVAAQTQRDITAMTSSLRNAQVTITNPIEGSLKALTAQWDRTKANLNLQAGQQARDAAAAEVSRVTDQVAAFASVLQKGFQSKESFNQVVTIASNIPLPPSARAAINAMQTFGDSTTSFGARANTLMSLASIVAPKELQAVQGVLASAAPILSAAGPLLAMTGFAAPFAMGFSSLLGGGGGGPDPTIMRELSAINAKLDQIISTLNRIENEIIKNHLEVMRTLEAMQFDIRVLLWINHQGLVQPTVAPCDKALQSLTDNEPRLALSQYKECMTAIRAKLAPRDVMSIFTIYENLEKGPNNSTTTNLDVWTRQVAAHPLVFRDSDKWCGTLLLGALPLDAAGPAAFSSTPQSTELCADFVKPQNLIDPQILGFVITREIAVSQSFDIVPISPGQDDVALSAARQAWTHELRLLNMAVAQQAAWAGFANLDSMSRWVLDGTLENGRDERAYKALSQYQILTENIVRAALLKKFGQNGGTQGAYAFGYYATDPVFLQVSDVFAESAGRFFRPDGASTCFRSKRLVIEATNERGEQKIEEQCIALPTPQELQARSIKLTDPLKSLVGLRSDLLELVEKAQIEVNMTADDRARLRELVTMRELQSARKANTANGAKDDGARLGAWATSHLH